MSKTIVLYNYGKFRPYEENNKKERESFHENKIMAIYTLYIFNCKLN